MSLDGLTDYNGLAAFLRDQANRIEALKELTDRNELMLVLQHYQKCKVLEEDRKVEEDDWDWISFGIILKHMFKKETAWKVCRAVGHMCVLPNKSFW